MASEIRKVANSVISNRVIEKGEPVKCSPGYYYLIKAGVLKEISYGNDGNVRILGYYSEGHLIGFGDDLEYISLKDGNLDTLHYSKLLETPDYVLNLLGTLEARIKYHDILHTKKTDDRVLALLKHLFKTIGEIKDGWAYLTVRFSQEDIANTLNMQRLTVTRSIARLKNAGHIRREGQKIFVSI